MMSDYFDIGNLFLCRKIMQITVDLNQQIVIEMEQSNSKGVRNYRYVYMAF